LHTFNCTLMSFQVKKHIKQGEGHTGGIFSIEAPLHVSNVQVLDPVTGYDT
jgi:large subunit ribosomal protein L24